MVREVLGVDNLGPGPTTVDKKIPTSVNNMPGAARAAHQLMIHSSFWFLSNCSSFEYWPLLQMLLFCFPHCVFEYGAPSELIWSCDRHLSSSVSFLQIEHLYRLRHRPHLLHHTHYPHHNLFHQFPEHERKPFACEINPLFDYCYWTRPPLNLSPLDTTQHYPIKSAPANSPGHVSFVFVALGTSQEHRVHQSRKNQYPTSSNTDYQHTKFQTKFPSQRYRCYCTRHSRHSKVVEAA
mmetsp:Transcript_2121/g.3386  ORF Transcript_2121/g.3386 Transcript_2121/m.3386 type:complete len:237 (+) Transcript_2121:2245-2955(+)